MTLEQAARIRALERVYDEAEDGRVAALEEMGRLQATIAKQQKVIEAARFPENHLINVGDDVFPDHGWVAVPKFRFDSLRDRLAALEGKP